MKTTSKITKVGDSLYLLVPSNIVALLNLAANDVVEMDLIKISPEQIESTVK